MPPALRTTLAEVGSLIGQVWRSWNDDYVSSMGAALAYYTMFSLAPLLLIVISVAGLLFGEAAARGEMQAQLDALMGEQGASAIQGLLASVHEPSKGIAGTVLGVVLLLVGATTVFGELQDALDRIWRVPAKGPGNGWIALVRSRVLSFGMILSLGILLTVSLVISAMLSAAVEFGRRLDPVFDNWGVVIEVGNAVGGFVLAAMGFAMIFKVMPRVQVQWKDVWIGALFTAGLFTLGKSLIGLYIGRSGIASGFGAAGSLVVVLLWVYWSAQILLIGAEFTWVYANRFGSRRAASIPIPGGVPLA